jgi:dTDP-4-amino-4,6-dideoxygalactose transaminase
MHETCTPPAGFAIPLHRLPIDDADIAAMRAAAATGLLTGDGGANQSLAALAERTLGCARAFPTPSGTHALELMMRALPLEPGDEVIVPSFTFVSAANAVILAGGRPVLADIDPHTLNLDPIDASRHVTPRTRAVVTGHYAGIAGGLDALSALASTSGIALLEDAAHALGGRWRDRALGTWGVAAAFSFHGTKNLVAGEGGMMTTLDDAIVARAEIIREKGTDRSRFIRGDVDRYSWQEVGSSYLLSDLLAALIASQWQRLDRIVSERRARFEAYQAAFAPLIASGDLTLPVVPPECQPAYHIYFVRFATHAARDGAMAFLRGRGIEASSHYVPLHLSAYARRELGGRLGDCPVTEHAADRLLRLPLYPALAAGDQRHVIEALFAFFGQRPA